MTLEENKALVTRLYEEVLNGEDLEVIDHLVVKDYEEHDPLPGQGTGREGLKDRFSMLIEAFHPRFTIEDVIAEGDRVVVRWVNQGTHVGEFLGIPPTQRPATVAGVDIYRVSEGRLQEHWHVVDQLGMLMQLGVVTLPGGPGA